MSRQHWAEIEDFGVIWGMKFLVFVHRYLGRFVLPVFLYPVVAYYWLTNSQARASSRLYLAKLKSAHPEVDTSASPWTVFRHFMMFARSTLDRVSAWTGLLDNKVVRFDTRPEIEARLKAGQGVMMVTAHMGCLEVCRALADMKDDVKLNVLVHSINAERMNAILKPLNMDKEFELIEVTLVGPETTIALTRKINQGEIVVMVGDRVPPTGDKNTLVVDFLGSPAQFALGPWVLAHVLKCPVYTLLCLREQGGYRIHSTLLAERVNLPRGNRQQSATAYLSEYVRYLEEHCRLTPLQWFNFYPYWLDQGCDPMERVRG